MKEVITPSIRFMFFATLFFATMNTFIKFLGDYSTYQIVFFRSSITAIFCMGYLKTNHLPLIGKNQKLLFLRALFGCISMIAFFITIKQIPLGASVSLKYLSPIFTAIFAIVILNEKVRPIQWLFFLLAFGGVVLLKGFDTRIDTINLIIGIVGAAFAGLVYTIIRKIGNSEHPMVIINYFMSFSAIVTGLLMIPHWQNPSMTDWILLLTIGSLGYFAQLFMTKALQTETASRTIQIKYLELIFSLAIGFFWFTESYTLLSFLGILIILASMVMNVLVKNSK